MMGPERRPGADVGAQSLASVLAPTNDVFFTRFSPEMIARREARSEVHARARARARASARARARARARALGAPRLRAAH